MLDEGLATIREAARIQSQLVEDLLDVSRITTGRLKLSVSDVDLTDVIGKAIASLGPSAQEKNIAVHARLDAPPAALRGDAIRLQQVVWNLLSNAIKFTPPGGTVEVKLRCSRSYAQITVADDGNGIAPDLLPHIFDRFRQGETSGARQGGLGLGLSIVKNLVELHGGSVHAASAGAGKGAAFTVELPLAAGRRSGAPAVEPSEALMARRSLTSPACASSRLTGF
jgi:signal transduction histidine kinase